MKEGYRYLVIKKYMGDDFWRVHFTCLRLNELQREEELKQENYEWKINDSLTGEQITKEYMKIGEIEYTTEGVKVTI